MPNESDGSFDTSSTPTGDAINEWLKNPKEFEERERMKREEQAARDETQAAVSEATALANNTVVDDREKRLTAEELNTKAKELTNGIGNTLDSLNEYREAQEHQTDNYVRFTRGGYRYKVSHADSMQNEGQVRLFRRVHEEHSHLSSEEEQRTEEIDPEYWDEELFIKFNDSNPHDLKNRPVVNYRMTQRFRRNIKHIVTGEETDDVTPEAVDSRAINELFTHPLQNRDSGFAVSRATIILEGLRGNIQVRPTAL